MSQTLKLLLNSRKLRPTYETSLSEGVTVMMGLMQKREEELEQSEKGQEVRNN